MRVVSEWNLLISVVAFTLHVGQGTIVKDATLSNIAFENARKSNPFNSNVTEFRPADIIFTENKPRTCYEFLKLLAETEHAPAITVYSSRGSESLKNFVKSEPTSNFRLVQGNRTLAFLDIAAILNMREVSFMRPTHLNVNGNSIPLSNAIDIYASDLKPSIAVRYMNNNEYFFFENERVGATQLYNIIFQRPNYVYDFSSLELNGMKIPFETILSTLAYMPNLKCIHEGEKFDVITFLREYPKFIGKLQLELEAVVDDLLDVFKKVLKYTIVDLITVPTGMVPPYHALQSLQHLPELEAWRPGLGNNLKPIPLFLQDVYPDEDPKQNLIQVLHRGALVSVQSFIELLLTEGHIVFGDMTYAEKLPRDQDYGIRYDNYTFPIDSFLKTYGRTDAYYEVVKGSKVLSLKQLDSLKEPRYSIHIKKPEISIVSKYGVSFRNSELAYNLAQQKPRHVMIVHDGVSYTPEQFVHIFRDQMPEEFTVQQNGIDVPLDEIFKIIDINLTPQFLKTYKVMNVPHKGQMYTKDDILVAILENPDGFMIFDNGQFKSPINFKEHYGDNVPEYVVYYKDKPIKPQDIPKYLDLETILEEEFYPILYNGHTYQPRDVVNMLYNQQPDKVKILHKEQQYTPEEYKNQFASTKFQVLYNDYPIQAQDLEQILDFDLKNPKSQLRFFTIKYKGVSYTKEDIVNILMEQSPPNVKILHEGVFYLPKQFKRKFGSNLPSNFAVVQNRRIIPSKLLPTIVRLGDSKQTNPKIFPNIIYGGKEYTPDDILHLIISQNPPDVTIALRNKKFTPKQFERTYDGVYPITFSILFKNTIITPEEIVNIVDFEMPETTEPPKIIIYTTQRGQKLTPTSTTSRSTESTKSVEASTASTEKSIRIVEEDDLTTIGGKPRVTASEYSQEISETSRWEESEEALPGMPHKENPPRSRQPPEDINLKVEDVGPSKDFDESHDFPYIVHDGMLYPPPDVVKSIADLITKGILSTVWKIHHENTEYSPAEFIAKFKSIPRKFQIFKGNEKISPERIANLINLKNYGFMINEEMADGKMFPHLVINGVIYTPQDVLHCLITKSPNETYIVHQGRTYHPKTFQEEYQDQPLPNFDVVVRNETIPKEKLPSIVNLDEESFLTTAPPPRTTPISIAPPTFVSGEGVDLPPSSRDQVAMTVSTEYPSTDEQYTFAEQPNITADQPQISTEEYTESTASASAWSYELTTETPIASTAKQFPYIVYNGSIFSPYEVVKTLRDQKPDNVTIVADHQEYTPEEFYEHYVTDNPEHFKIFQDGNYVSPSEIPKLVNFDSSTYGSYDYEYDDRGPATPKPTISTDIIKQILRDNPNTRVVLEGKEYEPEEIDDWDKVHIGQKDVKIVEVEPTFSTIQPEHENYLRELNKTPKGKDIKIKHDDKPYALENFLKLFQNRIPENIRVVNGDHEIPIENVKDLLLPFRDETFPPTVSQIIPRVDNEHIKTIPSDDRAVRPTKTPSPMDVFISNGGPDLEGPDPGSVRMETSHYPLTGVKHSTRAPNQADVISSNLDIENPDFDSVRMETTHHPISNHPTKAAPTAEDDVYKGIYNPTSSTSTTSSYSSEENYDYQEYTPSPELNIEEIINAHPSKIPVKGEPSGGDHGTTPRHGDDKNNVYQDVPGSTYKPTLPSHTPSFSSDAASLDGDSNNFNDYESITPYGDNNMRTTPDQNLPTYNANVVKPEKPTAEVSNVNEEQPLHQKTGSTSETPTNEDLDGSLWYLPNESTKTYIPEYGEYPDITTNYNYSSGETITTSTESYDHSDEKYPGLEQGDTMLDEINRPNHKTTTEHPLISNGVPHPESTINAEGRNPHISEEIVGVPKQRPLGNNVSIPTKPGYPEGVDISDDKLANGMTMPTIPYSSENSEIYQATKPSTMPTTSLNLEGYDSVPNRSTNPNSIEYDTMPIQTKPSHGYIPNIPKKPGYSEDVTIYDDSLQSDMTKPTLPDSSIAFSQPMTVSGMPTRPATSELDDVSSTESMKPIHPDSSEHTTISEQTRPYHGDIPNIPTKPEYPEGIGVDHITLPSGMNNPTIPNSNGNSDGSQPPIPSRIPNRPTMPEGDDLIFTDAQRPNYPDDSEFAIPTKPHYGHVPRIPTTPGYPEEVDVYEVTRQSSFTKPTIPSGNQYIEVPQPTKPSTTATRPRIPEGNGSEPHRPTYPASSEHDTIPVPLRPHHGNISSTPTKPEHPEFGITGLTIPGSSENIKVHQPMKPSIMPSRPTIPDGYDIISTKPNKQTYPDNIGYSTIPVPSQPHRGYIPSIPTKPGYPEDIDIYEVTLPSDITEPTIQDNNQYSEIYQPTKHSVTKIKPGMPEGYDIRSAEPNKSTSLDSTTWVPSKPHSGIIPSIPMKPRYPEDADISDISLPNGMTRPTVPDSSHYIEVHQPVEPTITPSRPQMPERYDSEPNRPIHPDSSEYSTIPTRPHHDDIPGKPIKPEYPQPIGIYDVTQPSGMKRPTIPDSSQYRPRLAEEYDLEPISSIQQTVPTKPDYVPGRPTKPEYPENIDIYDGTLPNGMTKPIIPHSSEGMGVNQPTKPSTIPIMPTMPEGYDMISAELNTQTYPDSRPHHDDIPGKSTKPGYPVPIDVYDDTLPSGYIPSVPTKPGHPEDVDIYEVTLPSEITEPTIQDNNQYSEIYQPTKHSITKIKPRMPEGYDITSTEPNRSTSSDSSKDSTTWVPSKPHNGLIPSIPMTPGYPEGADISDISLPNGMTRPTVPDSSQYIEVHQPAEPTITPSRPQMPERYDSESNRPIHPDSSDYSTIPLPTRLHHDDIPGKPIKPEYPQPIGIYDVTQPSGMNRPTMPASSQYMEVHQPMKPTRTPTRPRMPEKYDSEPNRPLHPDSSDYSTIPLPTRLHHDDIPGKPIKPEYPQPIGIYDVTQPSGINRPTMPASSQYMEVHQPMKPTRMPTRPRMPEKYDIEPNRPTYPDSSKHSTIPVPTISHQDNIPGRPTKHGYPENINIYDATLPNGLVKPTMPYSSEGVEVYQPRKPSIIPIMTEGDMISIEPNRPTYPANSEHITIPMPTRPHHGELPGKPTKPGNREPIDIYGTTLPSGMTRPTMPHSIENIGVPLPTNPSIMPTRPADIYNEPGRTKSPLDILSPSDQTFEGYPIENFDKPSRPPISGESFTNYPTTWVQGDSPTTVQPLYTMGPSSHLGVSLFTTPTPTAYYEGMETTPISQTSESPMKPTMPTSHNSLIITNEDVLDTMDIIHNLAVDNPNEVEVLYNDDLYKPKEFIKKYPYLPYNPDVKYVIDNDIVSPFKVASQFPPKPKPSNNTVFPNVIKDGHMYSPKDVLQEISHNPEGQCVEVIYDGKLYTPKQFYNLFQRNPHFPNNFQMQVSGQPLDPKLFLSIFKILGKKGTVLNNEEIGMIEENEVGHPYIVKKRTTTQKPNIVRTYIHKVMSKEPNFEILHENNTYDPLEYLEVFGDNPTSDFKIVYEDMILTPKSFYQLIKYRPHNDPRRNDHRIPDQQFPTVSFEGQQYSPRLVLESLAVSNPNHVKVKHQGKLYTPMQLIASFNTIPTAFELVDTAGNTINPMHTSEYLPGNYDSGRKSVPIENKNFPTIVSNGEIFTPREVLMNIKRNRSNVLVRLKNGRMLSAWQVLSMQPMPEQFDLIMNGKKIEPIEIARIIKLQKY